MPIKLLAGICEVLNFPTIPHRPASEKYKEFTTIKNYLSLLFLLGWDVFYAGNCKSAVKIINQTDGILVNRF